MSRAASAHGGARRAAFAALLSCALGGIAAFLALPLVALLTETPLRDLPTLLRQPAVREAIRITAETNLAANAIILALGTPAAFALATRRFPGRALVITLLELPLVLPPAVAGVGLLAAYGRFGLVGAHLDAFGILIPFSELAVTVAIVFVASPYYLRQAIAAFEGVDASLVDAARTLGSGPAKAFATVSLPLAGPALVAGWALAFARGVGEFGATLIFAGNVAGVTQTLPLAVYEQLESSYGTALAISTLLLAFSATVLLGYKSIQRWTTSRSISTSPSAASP